MTDDLQRAIVAEAAASGDPLTFWAEFFGAAAGFAGEHIGGGVAFQLLSHAAVMAAEADQAPRAQH